MNGRELLEAMSFIDEELVHASETSSRHIAWKRWTSLAACLCLILIGVVFYRGNTKGAPEEAAEPKAALDAESSFAMGAGAPADNIAVPEAAAEGAAEETRCLCTDTFELELSALVRLEQKTDEGFTAIIVEMSEPFTDASRILVITDQSGDSLIPGNLYQIKIIDFDPQNECARVSSITCVQEEIP